MCIMLLRVGDATHFLEVIKAAEGANIYHDLVKYLLMVRRVPIRVSLLSWEFFMQDIGLPCY